VRIVNQIPLYRLWDQDGEIEAVRERWLTKQSLREMLSDYPVEFYVADVGHPLLRIDVAKCYDFWKAEVESNLVEDPERGFRLESFPGEFAYVASEWSGEIQTPIVLLEKYH
jgi:hypothetical protein